MLQGLGAELYGLWVAAAAVAGMVGVIDLGLGWSVTREVAGGHAAHDLDGTARFFSAAGNAYLAIGVVGAAVVGAAGLPMSSGLDLSAAGRTVAPVVFVLAGVALVTKQLLSFATAALHGLRRFEAANLVFAAGSVLWAAGVVVLLAAGRGIVAIAAWRAIALAVAAGCALWVTARLEPRFRIRLGRLDWRVLCEALPFGFVAQTMSAVSIVMWRAPQVLIGLILGSPQIVPFYLGQKFPLAVSSLGWRAAEAVFPAAAEHHRARDDARATETLEFGTRWIVVLTLPFCIVLWAMAPNLLRAWLGQAHPQTVLLMRLITVAVFADAVGAAALNVIMGRGAAATALLVLGGEAAASLALALWLLRAMGVVGAAWALVLPAAVGSMVMVKIATSMCRLSAADLMGPALRGRPAVTLCQDCID